MGGIVDSLFGSEPEQVGTAQSPGDAWLQQMLQPMLQRGIGAGKSGRGLYPTAGLPNTPQAQGYQAQGYDAPQAQYNSPADFAGGYTNIINRMMEPYGDALGGSMGGFSGAGQNIMGSAMGQIAPQIMNQYTQYQQPFAQMQNQASMFGAGAQNQAGQFNAGAQNQMAGLGYQGGLQRMQNQQQSYAAPWNLAGMYSGSTGSPMIQQGQQGLFGGLINGLAGGAGMMGGMMGMDALFGSGGGGGGSGYSSNPYNIGEYGTTAFGL